LRPDYNVKETFGASLRNVSKGRYYKASSRTFNFVTLTSPTPGAANNDPMVGPIVISEIMYHAPNGEADYIELTNISTNQVTLFDSELGEPWRMTKGFSHVFSSTTPVVMKSGEKLLLVRNAAAFALDYTAAPDTQIIQWDSGALDNGGETLELSQPGDTNLLGELQFIRVDRVDYSDSAPWPTGPDGSGTALVRINERAYGNDFANWTEGASTPGQTAYEQWAAAYNLPIGQDGPTDDPDSDSIVNAMEYANGTDPLVPSNAMGKYALLTIGSTISFTLPTVRPDLGYRILKANSLTEGGWSYLDGTVLIDGQTHISALDPTPENQGFFRLEIILYDRY
jgi:hypothetical protein